MTDLAELRALLAAKDARIAELERIVEAHEDTIGYIERERDKARAAMAQEYARGVEDSSGVAVGLHGCAGESYECDYERALRALLPRTETPPAGGRSGE